MGRPSFPRHTSELGERSRIACQCPEWGDLHFHASSNIKNPDFIKVCQCPEWGDLHFHKKAFTEAETETELCQCPEWGDLHFHPNINFIY